MNFLITGGKGHVGSYIVEELCKQYKNSTVVVVDNDYNSDPRNLDDAKIIASENGVKIVDLFADVADFSSLEIEFRDYNFDYVFHEASLLTLDSKKFRQRAVEVNTLGFTNICELCLKYKVKKLIYASSASVYGNPDTFPTSEDHHFNNNRLLYGATKIADEYIATSYMKEEGLSILGMRYFNIYGERQSRSNVYTQIVPKWIECFLDSKTITIYGNGKQTMDLVHGADLGRLNIEAMNCKYTGFLNIGSGIETSVLELYKIMKNVFIELGFKEFTKNEVIFDEHDPNLVSRRLCDVSLMHEHLGKHSISVNEGITRAIKHALKSRGIA